VTTDDRIAAALERIATALEQSVLERIEEEVAPLPAFSGAPSELPPPPAAPPAPDAYRPPIPATSYTAVCPVHGTPWKLVPAGVSKRTGKPYDAFYTCSNRDCQLRPAA
jgi:hypothetical protein